MPPPLEELDEEEVLDEELEEELELDELELDELLLLDDVELPVPEAVLT